MLNSLRIADNIADINPADWDACANPAGKKACNPFISHAFLLALEASGCATKETGWQPCHLLVESDQNQIRGVAPAYLKSHSRGEYVFDQGWADALYLAGEHYYPKLQLAVPFTPVTGRRLLAHPDAQSATIEKQLLQGCITVCKQLAASSVHITFMPKSQWQSAHQQGYLQRVDQQYHWLNDNYRCFEDFLDELSAKKRKNLKRERREALQNDIQIEWITGAEIKEAHWDAFYPFYLDTGSRKWGVSYLNRTFFSLIGEAMSKQLVLMLCRRGGHYIAGALHVIGGDTLYGRYWGCIEDHRFLHFETCYYQAIDFAIAHSLQRVEAGAQGRHKLIRGYLPCPTFSAHWIAHPGLHQAVAQFLNREIHYVEEDIRHTASHTPYKKTSELSRLNHLKQGAIKKC